MFRVLLVDDHRILRQAMARLLDDEPDIEIIGEANNGEDAVRLACVRRPNVVLMDVSMPRLNGIDATRQIVEKCPGVRVVGLSMHEDATVRQSMLEAGAQRYVTKGGPPEALFAAIRDEPERASSSS